MFNISARIFCAEFTPRINHVKFDKQILHRNAYLKSDKFSQDGKITGVDYI